MAVALSLLIVLPTLAQVSGDRTDGRLSVGDWIDVRIADNLDGPRHRRRRGRRHPLPRPSSRTGVRHTSTTRLRRAKDTYFNGTLYVSNKEAAYNTILIYRRR